MKKRQNKFVEYIKNNSVQLIVLLVVNIAVIVTSLLLINDGKAWLLIALTIVCSAVRLISTYKGFCEEMKSKNTQSKDVEESMDDENDNNAE
ncbi:MAG: hypothetical protein NC350_03725 [Corallococcus sp.]|nr:hypothetical protein [Corallococcus sp.]